MSTEQTSGQQDQGSANDQSNQEQTVPKSHADRILGEKKALQGKMKELQDRLDLIEREKLEKEGNLQTLVDRYKKDVDTKDGEIKSFKNRIVQDRVKFALKAEAEKAGVIKYDVLEKLVDFNSINVDPETLELDTKDLTKAINSLKAENPFLFKTTAVKPNNMNPAQGDTSEQISAKSLSDLPEKDLLEMLKNAK